MQLEFEDGTVITNEHICSEEMSIEESLCSDENLRFGACEASCFKVRIVNSGSFEGQELEVSMILQGKNGHIITADSDNLVDSDGNYISFADYSAEGLTIPYGKYKVYSDKPSNDRMWRDLECYDAMYDILNADVTTWYLGLTFPMTLKNFRDSFFNEVGITQETTTLINDSLSILGGFVSEGVLSGKTIIEAICEVNAVFGHINRNGVFEYISLPSQETIEYEWYIADTGTYEDYDTETITRVMARSEGEESVPDVVGVAGNDLILENNPLLYGYEGTSTMTTVLTNILNAVSQITYKPFEVETYGNPMLPVGTSIQINTKKYDPENGYSQLVINSLVMQRSLTGIQALKDTIKAEGNRYRPTEVNSLQSELTRTKGRVHTLINNVNELTSEIYEVDPQTGQKTSRIEQTAEQIVLKVDSNGNMVEVELGTDPDDSSATAFNVKATNVNFSAFNLNMQSTNFSLTSSAVTLNKNGLVVNGTYWKTTLSADTFKINSNYTGNKEVATLGVMSDSSLQYSLTGSGALHLHHTSNNYNLLGRNDSLLISSVAPYTSNSNAYQAELQVDKLVLGCANKGSSYVVGGEKVWIRNVSNSFGVVMVGGNSSADVQIRDDILNPTSTISLRTVNTRVNSFGVQAMDSSPGAVSSNNETWRQTAVLSNLTPGRYLLIGTIGFGSSSTGGRYAVISETSASGTEINHHARTAVGAYGATRVHVICQVAVSSNTTYYLNGYQNSGGQLNMTGRLTAVRIGTV
jgi:hypothetical protein